MMVGLVWGIDFEGYFVCGSVVRCGWRKKEQTCIGEVDHFDVGPAVPLFYGLLGGWDSP